MSKFFAIGARVLVVGWCVFGLARVAGAQAQPSGANGATPAPTPAAAPSLPADYVIGPEDVLGVVFWRDQDMTGDVTVRPDGMVTLPLLGDVAAAGLTPDVLREQIQKAASKYVQDPSVTIVVRQINSRKVFITGEVKTPGAFPLTGPRTVMQVIALAGGLNEWADAKNITVARTENGRQVSFKFNYKDVAQGKKLEQNILLKPGDTVIVP
ncbi:MAG TPA: polysaccharide biosynthesis/export family protein [Vicinamibacterales bacterium]|nr:polysaccharide biosynthesis/export family protein [Vicinamibacterales bacterium]